MSAMKIRQLIDMAIGFPESGQVNFSALHCVLIYIAKKLEITDEVVEYRNIEKDTVQGFSKTLEGDLPKTSRLFSGYSPDANNAKDDPSEPDTIQESPSTDVVISDNQAANPVDQSEAETAAAIITPLSKQADEEVLEQRSANGVLSPKPSLSLQPSVHKLKERISKIEMTVNNSAMSKEISSGISIMKDQLDLVMEQILLLTFLTLSKKPDFKQIHKLHAMSQILLDIKKENIYIEGSKQIQIPSAPSLDWQSPGLQLNENVSEGDVLEAQKSDSTHVTVQFKKSQQDEIKDHLCYSPEKLLDQLMELKGEFCTMTNKINDLSARLLLQEDQHSFALIQETQNQVRDNKLATFNLKENQDRQEQLLNSNQGTIENIKGSLQKLVEEKVDKTHFETQLFNKVDCSQLQKKISIDQLLEFQCRFDKKLCELWRRVNENEIKFSNAFETFKNTLGFSAIDDILKKFKEDIAKDIQNLNELLKNYIASTNDDCAAAGARIKVLQDLACLSCDTTCVMRTMEKAKVAKLPSAYASNIISPLITYELGSIRKSGLMGYYRKDEFPHATNAWLTQQRLTGLKECIPRHAGGPYTIKRAKEHIQKMPSGTSRTG